MWYLVFGIWYLYLVSWAPKKSKCYFIHLCLLLFQLVSGTQGSDMNSLFLINPLGKIVLIFLSFSLSPKISAWEKTQCFNGPFLELVKINMNIISGQGQRKIHSFIKAEF